VGGGSKSRIPVLLHGKINLVLGRETKGKHNNVDGRTGEKLKEEGDRNNEKFAPLNFSVTELLVTLLGLLFLVVK
jgi:hypothetical protein